MGDWGNSRVQVFDSSGEYLYQIGSPGDGLAKLTNPTGLGIGPDGDLWVMDRGNSRVQRFQPDGKYVGMWSRLERGLYKQPTNIAFDADGNFWVSEWTGHRVRMLDAEGKVLCELAPETFHGPHGLLFDSTGALYVADTGNCVVRKFRRVG